MARTEKTELHYNLYHVSNTLETIIKFAKRSFIASRGKHININGVCKILDASHKVYSLMPVKHRDIIKMDMDALMELKDIDNLKKMLYINKMMQFVEEKNIRLDVLPHFNTIDFNTGSKT